MRGFHYVLLALATYFSIGLIVAVSVPQVRDSLQANAAWLQELGLVLFVLGCIALRLAVHFQHWPSTAVVLVVFYTSGLTFIGSTLAVSLQYDFDDDNGDDDYSEANRKNEDGLRRGQMAVCLGCAVSLLVFVIVQAQLLNVSVASAAEPPLNRKVHGSAVQSAGLCLFASALCLIIIDDRIWDWRYAATVFASLILSVYLNAVCTWMLAVVETDAAGAAKSAFHVTALIILQPILFAENWVLLCLLDSPSAAALSLPHPRV
jgi:hypothetical protein